MQAAMSHIQASKGHWHADGASDVRSQDGRAHIIGEDRGFRLCETSTAMHLRSVWARHACA
jgi:hypothetical protein